MNLETITGTVVATKFRSADGWTVMVIRAEGEREETGATGILQAEIEKGWTFTAKGEWNDDRKFGRQFKFQALEVHPPTTADQIKDRLEYYPGVGPAMAARIVEKFGDATWDVMDNAIGSLKQVSGIGTAKLNKIIKHHAEQHGPVAKIQNRLIELQAPPRLAMAIHEAFGARSIEMLDTHPYQVAAKVDRFGFQLAEKIGRRIGMEPECEERVDAGILHVFSEAQGRGHCGMPPAEVTAAAMKLLRLSEVIVDAGVSRLTDANTLALLLGEVGGSASLYFLRRMDWVEDAVGHAVARLATSEHKAWPVGDLPDKLSAGQVDAVKAVAKSGFVIVTGGPGTGKSTVLLNVVDVANRAETHIILCAPTGRAAKRMAETTGLEAKTIHRLLGMNPGTSTWNYDRSNPLPAGLVVIDEWSMVDIKIAQALFDALTSEHRVLIVGDADQLPSVGPGNVLRDLIKAADRTGAIPVVRLTEVFRQAKGSTIISNAHRINAGETLAPDPKERGSEGQFYVVNASDAHEAHRLIVKLASQNIPSAYGLDRMTDVQVLCPMHKGPAGTEAFNTTIQNLYTREGDGFGTKKGRRFYLGDRVMNTKNDYDRNVFNGDIGTVTSIGAQRMTVDFDGVETDYERKELGPIRLSYAISIHKSQGSEFPAVVIPILMSHSIMLRRNLIYTAVTRASRLCVIVGQARAIRQAIEAADAAERWTGLTRRLVSAFGHDSRHLRLVGT